MRSLSDSGEHCVSNMLRRDLAWAGCERALYGRVAKRVPNVSLIFLRAVGSKNQTNFHWSDRRGIYLAEMSLWQYMLPRLPPSPSRHRKTYSVSSACSPFTLTLEAELSVDSDHIQRICFF